MRAQAWQKLLKDKGWLQGDLLVVPDGYTLYFIFDYQSLGGSFKHDQVVEITETWIAGYVSKTSYVGRSPFLCYHLWEDLSEIQLVSDNPKEANLLLRPADKG